MRGVVAVHVLGEADAISPHSLGANEFTLGDLETVSSSREASRGESMFEASRTVALADHFRIPYRLTASPEEGELGMLTSERGSQLLWPVRVPVELNAGPATIAPPVGGGIQIFARVIDDALAESLLSEHTGSWRRTIEIRDAQGSTFAWIWQERDGSVFLPFDPDEVCHNYWSERYVELAGSGGRGRLHRALMRSYYCVRRALPRAAQIWLRRRYSRVQERIAFPGWPAEPALHDFFDLFLGVLATVAAEPVPFIAPWPAGHRWALVLTHDVETAEGLTRVEPIVELERSLGLRSSWNFVPRRYEVSDTFVRELLRDGFEPGVHGLHHDGRDLVSLPQLRKRLPAMREAAERWGAVGFRSPASHRNWDWMPLLGFDYDSSYPDTDPYEPQSGGCCTWLPFFNGGMVELPITMPHDHNLFVILDEEDERLWIEKADFLRERGGMALIVTHPDYLIDERMRSYERFVRRYAQAEDVWKALPREVSSWWRRRSASRIERTADGWSVIGAASPEARIEFATEMQWC
ncbi:MAG: hypothetical protein ACR2L9_13450 [Solirubrobacteraceae bacterium]